MIRVTAEPTAKAAIYSDTKNLYAVYFYIRFMDKPYLHLLLFLGGIFMLDRFGMQVWSMEQTLFFRPNSFYYVYTGISIIGMMVAFNSLIELWKMAEKWVREGKT